MSASKSPGHRAGLFVLRHPFYRRSGLIDYKGFKITVHAGKDLTRNEWKPEGSVVVPGSPTVVKPLPVLGDRFYPTREAAVQAGEELIKRLIDSGEV